MPPGDTSTIIGNLNMDLSTFMKGAETERADFRLARLTPRFW